MSQNINRIQYSVSSENNATKKIRFLTKFTLFGKLNVQSDNFVGITYLNYKKNSRY